MNKKPIILFVLPLLLIALLAGCAGGSSGDRLTSIKSAGKLIMGTEAGYIPFEFQIMRDGKAEIVGMDIEIAREIAKDMGVELVVNDMAFDGLPTAVQQGAVDIAIAGMNPTPERLEAIDFSDSYFKASHSIVVRAGEGAAYTGVESFAGKTIGAQKGTTQEALATGSFADAGAKSLLLPQIDALLLELKSGNIDGVIMETPVCQAHVRRDSSIEVASFVIDDPDTGVFAIGVQKNNPDLMAAVNATIKRLRDAGKLEELYIAAQQLADENDVEE